MPVKLPVFRKGSNPHDPWLCGVEQGAFVPIFVPVFFDHPQHRAQPVNRAPAGLQISLGNTSSVCREGFSWGRFSVAQLKCVREKG